MIAIAKLQQVQKIVCHRDCADGMASAMILLDALRNAKVTFVQYNTPELERLEAEPGMLFCDMSPPSSRADEFLAAEAIVLDHHETQRELVQRFAERDLGVYGQNERMESGAMLAFCHVWRPLERLQSPPGYIAYGEETVEHFATLAGIYDTWQRGHELWRKAHEQAEALLFWPQTTMVGTGLFGSKLGEKLNIGRVLLEKLDDKVSYAAKHASTTKIGPYSATVFEGSTQVVNELAERAETDIVCAFGYLVVEGVRKIKVSLRTRKPDIHVGNIAKALGGGGHAGAGAFSARAQGSPYDQIHDVVAGHSTQGDGVKNLSRTQLDELAKRAAEAEADGVSVLAGRPPSSTIEVAHCVHCHTVTLAPTSDECTCCGGELYPVTHAVPLHVALAPPSLRVAGRFCARCGDEREKCSCLEGPQ